MGPWDSRGHAVLAVPGRGWLCRCMELPLPVSPTSFPRWSLWGRRDRRQDAGDEGQSPAGGKASWPRDHSPTSSHTRWDLQAVVGDAPMKIAIRNPRCLPPATARGRGTPCHSFSGADNAKAWFSNDPHMTLFHPYKIAYNIMWDFQGDEKKLGPGAVPGPPEGSSEGPGAWVGDTDSPASLLITTLFRDEEMGPEGSSHLPKDPQQKWPSEDSTLRLSHPKPCAQPLNSDLAEQEGGVQDGTPSHRAGDCAQHRGPGPVAEPTGPLRPG